MPNETPPITCVSLNTALDRILEVSDLEIGGHVRGRLVSIQPAGKAVNVARLLGTLGTGCVLTGFVGEGDRHRFARSFAKTGVRVEMFEGHGPTRENVTLIDPSRGVETHIRDVGFALTEDDLGRLRKKLGILATAGGYVLFAGSLAPGLEADTFAALLAECAERGARVAVDSSGPGLEALRRAKGLWLVKPNHEELGELAGRTVETGAQVRRAAENLLARIELVMVTRGEEGAILFSRKGAWRATPRVDQAEVVNTVGCGDALLAGFVAAHARGAALEECLRQGVAVGTAAALKVLAGEVDPADVERFHRTTEVKAFS
ncbi:MAG: hexose kinase [Phycisphaerae bacterium]|nr:hexose kinase [Phycisphaerae bacterium]